METQLEETEVQVERLNESLKMLGAPARAKPCKGMAGLVEEGEEVMEEGRKKDDAPADLGLSARLFAWNITKSQPIPPREIWPFSFTSRPSSIC